MQKSNVIAVIVAIVIAALLAPITLRLGEVPVTLQTLVLFCISAVLGKRSGFIVAISYLLLGALGLDVFAGYQGGIQKLIGPTSGFLWAFPLVCFILAYGIEKGQKTWFHFMLYFFRAHVLLLIPGFIVLYLQLPDAKLFDALVRLLPGLLIKTIFGGLLSLWLLKKIPPHWTELKAQ